MNKYTLLLFHPDGQIKSTVVFSHSLILLNAGLIAGARLKLKIKKNDHKIPHRVKNEDPTKEHFTKLLQEKSPKVTRPVSRTVMIAYRLMLQFSDGSNCRLNGSVIHHVQELSGLKYSLLFNLLILTGLISAGKG